MPKKSFTEEELATVDMSMADEQAGSQGETIREMIRAMYHCESEEEVDRYLRRFIAS